MSSVVTKHLVAHTRGYKFIFIRSHQWKKSKKTKSNVSAIVWTPSAPAGRSVAGWSRRQICRAGKEKATLEAEIARLREVHSQKLVKKHRSWWRCRFSAQLPKKTGWYGQAEEKCSRTGGCAPNTALGREMGLQEMTGFSKTAFKRLRRLVRSYQPASGLP